MLRPYFGFPTLKELGLVHAMKCPICPHARVLRFGIEYKLVRMLGFFPIFSYGKQFLLYCEGCGTGDKVFDQGDGVFGWNRINKDSGEWDSLKVNVPLTRSQMRLPWLHRFGWMIPVGSIILLAIVSAI